MSPIHITIEREDGGLIQDFIVGAGETIPLITGEIHKTETAIQELERRLLYVEGTKSGGCIRGEIARTPVSADFKELLLNSRDELLLNETTAPVIGSRADKLNVVDRFNFHKRAQNTQRQEGREDIGPCMVRFIARKL